MSIHLQAGLTELEISLMPWRARAPGRSGGMLPSWRPDAFSLHCYGHRLAASGAPGDQDRSRVPRPHTHHGG